MPGASCWDKMHKFYIPNGLFREDVPPMRLEDDKLSFQCCCVGSTVYKRKREAMGGQHLRRGRRVGHTVDFGVDENFTDNEDDVVGV